MDRFQAKLIDALSGLQHLGLHSLTEPRVKIAMGLTQAIQHVRNAHGLGFLPDRQQWRLLEQYLEHDRFVLAATSGYWRPEFLAMVGSEELKLRLSVLNGLSEAEFKAQLFRPTIPSDPEV